MQCTCRQVIKYLWPREIETSKKPPSLYTLNIASALIQCGVPCYLWIISRDIPSDKNAVYETAEVSAKSSTTDVIDELHSERRKLRKGKGRIFQLHLICFPCCISAIPVLALPIAVRCSFQGLTICVPQHAHIMVHDTQRHSTPAWRHRVIKAQRK